MPRTGGERRRTTIVEEAIRQFGREGYAGASLESIAHAVGVRKQTLLYYFKTKDDLLEARLAAAGKRVAGVPHVHPRSGASRPEGLRALRRGARAPAPERDRVPAGRDGRGADPESGSGPPAVPPLHRGRRPPY